MNHLLSVKSQEEIAHNIYKMVIHGPITSKMKTPGQFAHIRVNETSAFMLRLRFLYRTLMLSMRLLRLYIVQVEKVQQSFRN